MVCQGQGFCPHTCIEQAWLTGLFDRYGYCQPQIKLGRAPPKPVKLDPRPNGDNLVARHVHGWLLLIGRVRYAAGTGALRQPEPFVFLWARFPVEVGQGLWVDGCWSVGCKLSQWLAHNEAGSSSSEPQNAQGPQAMRAHLPVALL
jgi:hypothetical protein